MAEDRFFDEFAEDFFAESTEHLAALRRGLLSVEEAAQHEQVVNAGAVTEIARSLHTLKGLNGMVGLTDAATVAHALEECVRVALVPGATPQLTDIGLLISGARTLESCLSAFRMGAPAPDTTALLAELRSTETAEARAEVSAQPQDSGDAARNLYHFTFKPSAELASRGVGVEVIRARLQSLGEIQGIAPRVASDGTIAFDFTVALAAGREPLEEWRADAMTWEAVNKPSTSPIEQTTHRTADGAVPRSNLVRVDLTRLDELMLLVGELVMSRGRLDDSVSRLRTDRSNQAVNQLEEISERVERQLRDLRTAVMRVRLVPIGEVFERMRFVARDVAGETGKQARVEMLGGKTEIDKVVVERMLEPLLHLVRNAVSHGLETPQERVRAGKDPIGRVLLRADSIGDTIIVQVEDDGRGLDFDKIGEAAVRKGVLAAGQIVDNENVIDILSAPGFSTRGAADLASGRGVGMDVVRTNVKELGGNVSVESVKGRGTCFTIRMPLTLMIVDALLVTVGSETIAVPQPSLREVLQIGPSEIISFENNEIIKYREGVLPIVRLRSLFGLQASAPVRALHVLVVGNDTHSTGLVVDRLIGLREIVVRSIADPLVNVPGIGGAAELSDGRVTLILDTAGIVRYAREQKQQRVLERPV